MRTLQKIQTSPTKTEFGCNRIIVFQSSLPVYRIDFFFRVFQKFGDKFTVYYSPTEMGALTEGISQYRWAKRLGRIGTPLPGIEWQRGALSVPIKRGDIVVLMGARSLTNLLIVLRGRLAGARTVWWGHYWSSTSKSYRYAIRMLLTRLSNAVLFYTDQEIEEYRKNYGVSDKRLVGALNNGINVTFIQTLRASYQAEKRRKKIVFIGRFTNKSGLGELLEALSSKELHDVELEVLGDGPDALRLRRLAITLGIADRILWHGGTVDEEQIASVMNRCRLFVYPGGVGLSLIHAMAYGLPAIVHSDRWRHMPEITAFTAGETGLCFPKHDIEGLAKAISSGINDDEALEKWSQNCIHRADSIYNTKIMAERFYEFVNRLIDSSS